MSDDVSHMVFPSRGPNFAVDPMTTAEVEAGEALFTPLADAVRELTDLVALGVDPALVAGVRADVESVTARLGAAQLPGPYGIRYNDEGRSWSWGNAVIGVRNALAAPLVTHHSAEEGLHWAETSFDARHVGDEPGLAHPGMAGLVLDHLMGETASGFAKVTMTGTLSITHVRPVPLGPVRLEARRTSDTGRKVVVDAHLVDLVGGSPNPAGPCVTATGLFIVPRWAL